MSGIKVPTQQQLAAIKKRADKTKDPDDLFGYGYLCWHSYTPALQKEGVKYLRKAADAGHASAWGLLGDAFSSGIGVTKNKDKAMKILRSRILDAEREKQAAAIAGERRAQVGTGDRSERIRTYNYPQSRVTDHRIGLTLYKLDAILNGNLGELIDAIITADTAAKLKEQ